MLKGKTVVVGVTGGIAAYKAVEVVSSLRKLNAAVKVIMTENAQKFVTPLTFQAISHNLVVNDMFAEPKTWDIQHISLAEQADLIAVIPATANIIGKAANGIADDMLTTTIMAAKAPVMFFPAMNTAMYENPIFQNNREKLINYGYIFKESDEGLMACGTTGRGRLPEPSVIVEEIKRKLLYKKDLKDKKILITAGPTREELDPVRFISNYSSGKMGYAFVNAALNRGASVKVISGPVEVKKPAGAEVIPVKSALDMYREVMQHYTDADIIIMVAAVADYRPAVKAENKIKKSGDDMVVYLEKNPDIAAELGKVKGNRIVVGTCAETENLVENALGKIKSKNFDLIMANDVTMEGAGFGTDTNIVKIIGKQGVILDLPILSKEEAANRVLDEVLSLL